MTPDQKIYAIGILINSALFHAGVFVAGFLTGNEMVWKLALVGAALCYFSMLSQFNGAPRVVSTTVVWLSIVAGSAAGIILLFNMKP